MKDILIILAMIVTFILAVVTISSKMENQQTAECQSKFGTSYKRGYERFVCVDNSGNFKQLQP